MSYIPPDGDLSSLIIEKRPQSGGGRGKRLGWLAASVGGFFLIGGVTLPFRWQRPVVEVATVQPAPRTPASALLDASGYVTARRRATVAAKVTGRVERVFAEEGLHVKAGQVLAELDCSQPRSALVSAIADRNVTAAALADLEVQLANADRELERARQLRAAGVNSEQALDAANTASKSLRSRIELGRKQTRAAEARIGIARQEVENCSVRSPFDGIVISKDAQAGEIVSPISAGGGFTRTGMATIVDMSSVEVEVDVPEAYIPRVHAGQRALAQLDAYPEWQIPAAVRTVIPTADRQKATVKVRLSFDQSDPRILPDMGVKVAFLDSGHNTQTVPDDAHPLIPKSAVSNQTGVPAVFIVVEQKLELRPVSLGVAHGSQVEVKAGVSPGDMLVVRDGTPLHQGQAVIVKR